MTTLRWLRDYLLGCTHAHRSWPQTKWVRGKQHTHVTCTDCGREFEYDWKRMRVTGAMQATK